MAQKENESDFPAHWEQAVQFVKELPDKLGITVDTHQRVNLLLFLIEDATKREEMCTANRRRITGA